MHLVHYLDKNNLKENPVKANWTKLVANCDHWSRNFLTDFESTPGKRITRAKGSEPVGTRLIMGATLDQCAQECRRSNKFRCREFDFCYTKTKNVKGYQRSCMISSNLKAQLENNSTCTLFKLITNGNTGVNDQLVNNLNGKKGNGKKMYSSGLGTGMAFLMLFIGIGCVALGVFGYHRYKLGVPVP
jgi:hypothetical protein